jgi:hypothetical protein
MVNSCRLPKSDWVGTRLGNDWIHLGPFPTCRPKEDDWVHEERMQLKAKNQSIAYRFICEGAARDEWRTLYVNTHSNEADLLTSSCPLAKRGRVLCAGSYSIFLVSIVNCRVAMN